MTVPESDQDGQSAAFFDLDLTLCQANSALLYAKYEYRSGRLSTMALLVNTGRLLLHRLSLLNVETAYAKVAQHWKGMEGKAVQEETLAWFRRDVAHRLAPGGDAVLRHHREQGERVVLLSNTSAYIAAAACEIWGMDDWLANDVPTDEDDRITGGIELPLCIGAGKATRAEIWARKHGISLEKSHFYSDSISDLPMLERVGHAYVVNPDAKLRAVATQRGWPILDWSQAS